MSLWTWVGIALAGGAGAVLRFVLDGAISRRASGRLPWGTLMINLSGSFLLGLLTGELSGMALELAGAATIGAYTTFSTWMLESHRLAEDGQSRSAALNVLVSLVLGLAAMALGLAVAGTL